MQKDHIKLIGFCESVNAHVRRAETFCDENNIDLLLNQSNPDVRLHQMKEALRTLKENTLCLVVDLDHVLINKSISNIQSRFSEVDGDVIFAASQYFRFENRDLHYFYWKHFPRPYPHFNYLDTSVFVGKRDSLSRMITDLEEVYQDEVEKRSSINDLLIRYYADKLNGCFETAIRLSLDSENRLFTSSRLSASLEAGKRSWIYNLLYSRNEMTIFESAEIPEAMRNIENIIVKDGVYYHRQSKAAPMAISLSDSTVEIFENRCQQKLDFSLRMRIRLLVLKSHYQTMWQLSYILRINKGRLTPERIFRHTPNKNSELNDATKLLISRLERKLPVSFAHYNDGELTFIKDLLDSKDHKEWFGRKQQQYNPILAERLYEAMKYRKDGYFVGVPCSIHHPALRKLADEIVGDYKLKVPAMTLHHNLAYMPKLLYKLRGREVFFFTNEFQDLSFFKYLGITVDPSKVIEVPFRNSYLTYDNFKDMKFPAGAVIVLTCGMLAKILTKVWFANHEDLSVIALGSSLDDHVQKEEIDFELYPKKFPLTKNLHKSRAFLFGYKEACKECFSY